MKVVLIDNYDSFTYNLYHYLSHLKCKVDVLRNDKVNTKLILKNKYKIIKILYFLFIFFSKLLYKIWEED